MGARPDATPDDHPHVKMTAWRLRVASFDAPRFPRSKSLRGAASPNPTPKTGLPRKDRSFPVEFFSAGEWTLPRGGTFRGEGRWESGELVKGRSRVYNECTWTSREMWNDLLHRAMSDRPTATVLCGFHHWRRDMAAAAKKSGAKKGAAGKGSQSEAGEGPTERGPLHAAHTTKGGAVIPKGAATGSGTATGAELINDGKKIPTGADAGSKTPIAGGPPKPDDEAKGGKPQGLQAEPAIFTVNGSLEPHTLPSASGPQSASAGGGSQEEVQKKLDDHRELVESQIKRSHRKLDEVTVARMSRSELSAVAHDRGYDVGQAGSRVTRAKFLSEQDNDDRATDEE